MQQSVRISAISSPVQAGPASKGATTSPVPSTPAKRTRPLAGLAVAGLALMMAWALAVPSVQPVLTEPHAQLTQQARSLAQQGKAIPFLAQTSPELLRALQSGEAEIHTIHLVDTEAEDGDVIQVTLEGHGPGIPFALTKSGHTVAIPVIGGKAPAVSITAVHDGQNRNIVTVGARTSTGLWVSSNLPEGGRETIPVKVAAR